MSALPAAALRAVRAPSTVLRAPAAPVARAAARPGRKQGLTVCRARARAAPAPVPAPALAPIVTVATGPLAGWPLLPPPLPPLPTPLVAGAVLLLALLLFRPWRKSGCAPLTTRALRPPASRNGVSPPVRLHTLGAARNPPDTRAVLRCPQLCGRACLSRRGPCRGARRVGRQILQRCGLTAHSALSLLLWL